jgi:DNA-binding SARP family transcriptional activator
MDVMRPAFQQPLPTRSAGSFAPHPDEAAVVRGPGSTAQATTRLLLLGGFQLVYEGALLALPVHAQRLLAYLALSEHSSRVLTAGTLWPDVREQRALGNLRSTVWRLQRICPSVVVASRNLLTLAEDVTVDVRECRAAVAHTGRNPTDRGAAELAQGSFCHELLPGWYEDWILLERDRLQHLRLQALEEAADLMLRRGHYVEALDAALAAVRSDPLRESARRLILRIHLAEGNEVEAMRHFHSYRALLAAELGIEPSPRTWALVSPSG